MDNHRFDDLARTMARRASRRQFVLAFAATAFGLRHPRRALAQAGSGLPLGAACATDSACSQAGGPVVCASNGIPGPSYPGRDDGPTNCCRYLDGACSDNAHCCLGLDCIGGFCKGSAAGGTGSNPGSAATAHDRLGSVWTVTEGPWTGTWTRQGADNLFSAVWTAPGYAPRVGDLRITIDEGGHVVAKDEPGDPADRYYCNYDGNLAADGVTVGGTRTCLNLEPRRFTATIS